MASITEHVIKLQELTQTNLEILQAINDSFFTKQDHLSVNIGGNSFAMPSFISLENKLNSLTANFENLVHAPESGEAFFDFGGNSRAIQVRPYTSVPNSLVLPLVEKFESEDNNIFKDFMSPNPYININVQSLPNDIVNVLVKKITPIHPDLVGLFEDNLYEIKDKIRVPKKSVVYSYKDLYKVLNGGKFKQGIDYIEYDSKVSLPIRKNIGSGVYVIEQIVEDVVDEHLDNYVKLKLRSDLTDSIYMNSLKYRLFDETIEVDLKVGDQLVTFEGNAKLEITKLESNTNTITARVMYGEFLNLVESTTNDHAAISSLSKLKFFSPVDFNNDKSIKVPLEEDQYVFVAVAALNDRMNVQSAWGSGLMLNTYELTSIANDELHFNDYYKQNVKNVGDILFEITSMMSNAITKYTKDEYIDFTTLRPVINTSDVIVTQINKHLNDSKAIQNIRALYSQKKEYQSQLTELQTEIEGINAILNSVSFDDTNGMRTTYTTRLTELANKKNELSAVISKLLNDIATSANNSEVPIENAKYRIRGFFDYKEFLNKNGKDYLTDHVKGIRVQYRYKNVNLAQGSAMTINDKFIFSDWNDMHCFDRMMVPSYDSGYRFKMQDNNDAVNEPSFNQIDIPISQGETVDIRLKLVYDFGYPFIYTTSSWSPIINIEFPDEFLKDVKITDIINENNNEIESNKFNNILKNEGIPDHMSDRITDQDIVYYHKPENIASGFYTPERRIIPLKDKLSAIDNALAELREEVFNSSILTSNGTSALTVSIKHGDSNIDLHPLQTNDISVESYGIIAGHSINADNDYVYNGIYTTDQRTGLVTTILNISLYNNSNHSIKLYSLFPGNRDTNIYNFLANKYGKNNYAADREEGVWIESTNGGNEQTILQGCNQFLYFRLKDVNDNTAYYTSGNVASDNNKLSTSKKLYKSTATSKIDGTLAYMYPRLTDKYGLCIDSNSVGSYLTLAPGEEISIPVIFEYSIAPGKTISKTMSFDILPSLYKDPITYTFRVNAKYSLNSVDKVVASGRVGLLKNISSAWGLLNAVKYKSVFK